MEDILLPGLPVDLIREAYASAPGNEIESGKFESPESSAALAANAFGFFLNRPADLPPLSGTEDCGWPATKVRLEAQVRFPWRGGLHPWLDVLVETSGALIGVESKRYEPLRKKPKPDLSKTYSREVWGNEMRAYERVRDVLRAGTDGFTRLDAAQLVKHAFGLRTAVHRKEELQGKRPVLFYVFAEPEAWPKPSERPIPRTDVKNHRAETGRFAEMVAGDEVAFYSCSYRDLLSGWAMNPNQQVRDHAKAVEARFAP